MLQENVTPHLDLENIEDEKKVKLFALYLDPSLGGVSGTTLTRFLIRAFPDPVTESLTF